MPRVKKMLLSVALVLVAAAALQSAPPVPRVDQPVLGNDFISRQFPIEGGQLACAHRAGSGPTLVLIPGTWGDRRVFTATTEHLDKSLNLIILETRGIGESWPPPERGSIEDCARDAVTVLDAMQVDTFFVGGHSLGGMTSIELGRQQPRRVRGIISIEGWTNAATRDAFGGDTSSTLSAEQLKFLAERRKETVARWSQAQLTDFGRVWRRWDGTAVLDFTDLPVLEMYGDRGKPRPDRRRLGLPDRKNIELVWFEGASHSLLLERPEGVAKAINEFVLGNSGGGEAADSKPKAESGKPVVGGGGNERQRELALPQNGFDLVVIGGTPGGIATAVTAARFGHSVALVEYHRHLGAMSASGLGGSDIRKRHVIQGFFREFVDRILSEYTRGYGADSEPVKASEDGYRYEAKVAERVFNILVQEQPTLTVLKYHQFENAETRDRRVIAVTVKNRANGARRTLKGKIFVDATYEGDVYAAAGAEFRVGRESRDEFGEPHAGHIYCDVKSKQVLGGTGAGDQRIQAYTYRMNITTNPANQAPLSGPPAGYDRTRYLGYLEDAKSGRFDDKPYLALVAFTINPLPNEKFDVNLKPSPLGYVFAEENAGYPTADWTERERIAGRIRDLALGLLWFLQHDEAVSPESREYALRYHLCRDEFTDNAHFPFQLYVREARRLVGEYMLTERNITEQPGVVSERRHADAIAVGEFPIDSMPCQKRQPGDTVVLEGYLCMLSRITRPYQIPYRIMIPKTIEGLIVPVAASTSHVAFSSIRLEPTWMALGQAAGVAAHLAIQHQLEPRTVPYRELHEILRAQRAVLEIPEEEAR